MVEQKDFGRRIGFPRGLPLLIPAPLGLGEDDGVDRRDGTHRERKRMGEGRGSRESYRWKKDGEL